MRTVAILLSCVMLTAAAQDRSALERIKPERLAAAMADAAAHEAARQPLDLWAPLKDYRAAIHVHADDSDHTGGTLPELLAEAKRAEVQVVMLSDHFRPPRDYMDGWRGLREGVLLIPGSEAHGFLVYPDASVMDHMSGSKEEVIEAVGAGTGMLFLSHVEERLGHPMDGLVGMEVYNRHYDVEDDLAVLAAIGAMVTDPDQYRDAQAALAQWHTAFLACQIDYPAVYLSKWDSELRHRPVVGIGAIDCHHNQVIVLKKKDDTTGLLGTNVDDDGDMREITADMRPGIVSMMKGHAVGDVVAQLDCDTYYDSFRTMSNHILAEELTEPAIRASLAAGRVYVSFDWMCDATGFAYRALRGGEVSGVMGGEAAVGDALQADAPAPCQLRLLRSGREVARSEGRQLSYTPEAPGAYRVEAWLNVDGEDRLWVLSNPIYVDG